MTGTYKTRRGALSRLEPLDRRCLLADFTVPEFSLVDGQLWLRGTVFDDQIVAEADASTISVRCNAEQRSYPLADVAYIVLNGFSGDDRIDNRTAIPSNIAGGSGADSLIGGSAADEIAGYGAIIEDGGDEYQNTIDGGLGNDTFYHTNDVLDYTQRAEPIEMSGWRIGPGGDPIGANVRIGEEVDMIPDSATIWGTPYSDTMVGGQGDRGRYSFFGFGGDDFLAAALYGYTDAEGGEGNDTFQQGTIYNGGQESALLQMTSIGGPGNDTVRLVRFPREMSNARFFLDPGYDTVDLTDYTRWTGDPEGDGFFNHDGQGVDRIIGIGATSPVTALDARINDRGDMVFEADGAFPVTIIGGRGNDRITGGRQDDRLFGGDGHDQLFGGLGDDALYGEGGNDLLVSGGGRDTLDGGAGRNKLIFTGPRIIDGLFGAPETLELAAVVSDRR